ncbi:MAG: response regulator, partial [Magnetococcales bacterium]|nr:response regulator [Magnetococcales bacterium]
VEVTQRAGKGLLGLIDDVLDLSKVEAGHMEMEMRPFKLRKGLKSTLEMIRIQAEEKGLTLNLELDPALPKWVMGDGMRLHQVLLNLLGNAVKFTLEGSVTLRAIPESDQKHIRIEVQDTGIGIPMEKLEEVFEGFVQADTSITRSFGGSGLGLTICRRLSQLMGGSIEVKSDINQGSLFRLLLPLPATESAHQHASGTLLAEPETPTVPNRSARILLVEDAEDNVLLIQAFLNKTNHETTIAWNGLEGVERFKSDRFDLVLMDVQMPELDGYSATRKIRNFEQESGQKRTPIIALTARAFLEEADRAKEAGCDDFLTKPIAKMKLHSVINTILDQQDSDS